ncbi:hypothetical protein TraAM80_00406 [Trypanosoma rangeli]|uniref:BILBO1 N-terminal domain-containing protein n=1 Tax=Trypanosoma rangeli TaxID=5698 RepID=A0A3R7MW67_TRYRA|nr:uncharacterized protein TraAM80_00406 [Trypanosoma rangeli]RNF12259.1 hypothetical protein TraAM80_00406 [Trypanosoma rangeli]|eukprot:RNF12259.1 hypothetical protein TraAM80_00406 [Trypanosoma rangeli]
MQYSICVATDCDGEKVNLRFLFDSYGPSLVQLLNRSIVAFNNVFRLRSVPRIFAVSAAVVFNDVHSTWDRLERSTQLLHNSQVYLFQPDILDLPAEIPEPFEGQSLLDEDYVSPRRDVSTSPHALGPSHYEPRPAITIESPRGMPMRHDSQNKLSICGVGSRVPLGSHYYDVKDDGTKDRFCSASFSTPKRGDSHDLLKGDQMSLLKQSFHLSSASPPIRQPRESSIRSRSDSRRSILREEREKIEYQMQLPIDEMRRKLREETRQLERSISPMSRQMMN